MRHEVAHVGHELLSVPHALISGAVVPYLLDRGLLTPAHVVDGDVTVTEASRRNRNFTVTTAGGPGFLLKQGVGTERILTVGNEALAYRLVGEALERMGARPVLARCFGFDDDAHILVLELVPDALNLRAYHQQSGRFSTAIAARLGDAISSVHRAVTPGTHTGASSRAPWTLALIHVPDLSVLREISMGNLHLIRVVQQFPEFSELLQSMHEAWSPTTLIHGDLKWDNCLVSPVARPRVSRVHLVDWELAAVGDPSWDVGSMLAEYLAGWVFSMPIAGDGTPEEMIRLARWPLERLQPAIASFWRAYADGWGWDPATEDERLLRSVRYAGVRLVQTAFEHLQGASALTAPSVCLLQLSLNTLKRPREAATRLLGLSASRAHTEPWTALAA